MNTALPTPVLGDYRLFDYDVLQVQASYGMYLPTGLIRGSGLWRVLRRPSETTVKVEELKARNAIKFTT